MELKSISGKDLGEIPAFTYGNFLRLLESIETLLKDPQLSIDAKNRISEPLETDGIALEHEVNFSIQPDLDARWPPPEYIASSED